MLAKLGITPPSPASSESGDASARGALFLRGALQGALEREVLALALESKESARARALAAPLPELAGVLEAWPEALGCPVAAQGWWPVLDRCW